MITAKFNLDLENFDAEKGESAIKTIEVTMQEASPFIVSDIFTSNVTPGGSYKLGSLIRDMMGTVIFSPKNLVEQIEESDNPFVAINKVFKEVNQFCNSPKRYIFLQKQSEAESKDMGDGNTESDTNRSETA